MIFSSWQYLIFFIAVFTLIMLLKSNKLQKGILLIASYFFYGFWDYRFLFLMFIMSFVSYFIGNKIYESTEKKKKWLTLGIVFNLSVLGFFKYFNFFIGSLNSLLANLHVKLSFLEIILPVGISFITFEVISYTIDIYRGSNKPAKTFWDLALLVAFFPHLVAGPILKPSHFLPQLDNRITFSWDNIERGIQLFLLGLVKKVLIADRLALFADPVFKNPVEYSSITVWLAVIAYALQIYCDFSGYSDMALGSAKCFGFDIPLNFNLPYISKNITEFWRRWHISLSTWLREYLYIPLGGNRKGKTRQYLNLAIVMLLGGLWHGASWNFVVWGGLHGIGLAVHKIFMDFTGKKNNAPSGPFTIFNWAVTFCFVCLAWVFFRSSDFSVSWFMVQKMLFLTNWEGVNWYATSLLVIIPIMVAGHFLNPNKYTLNLNTFSGVFILIFTLLALVFLAPFTASPFIYFQF